MLELTKFNSTKKKQGDAGLATAISYFVCNGCTVSIPLSDSQEYDLVVEINSQLKKVQVKTATGKDSRTGDCRVEVRTRTTINGKNIYLPLNLSAIDYLFILTSCGDKYLIPCNDLTNKTALSLTNKYLKYKV